MTVATDFAFTPAAACSSGKLRHVANALRQQ